MVWMVPGRAYFSGESRVRVLPFFCLIVLISVSSGSRDPVAIAIASPARQPALSMTWIWVALAATGAASFVQGVAGAPWSAGRLR